MSQEVIEHVSDKRAYLRIAFDYLKDGGVLIITTPNAGTFAAMEDELRRSWSDQPFEDLLTSQALIQMLRRLFEIVDVTTIIPGGYKSFHRIVNSPKLRRILQALGLYRAFEAACLRAGFGLHILAVAKKPLTKNYCLND